MTTETRRLWWDVYMVLMEVDMIGQNEPRRSRITRSPPAYIDDAPKMRYPQTRPNAAKQHDCFSHNDAYFLVSPADVAARYQKLAMLLSTTVALHAR